MSRRRGRPSNADRAAARAASGNAGTGDNLGGSIRVDPPAPAKVQSDVAPKAADGSFDIAAASPGFTASVEGPQETGLGATVEPTTGAEIRRGPGRPRGSTRKPIAASGVETLLLGIHSTLHAVFKAEELQLDPTEAKQLATAYADVAEYYPVLNFDPKYAALANFAGAVSIVYGSRIAAFRMRKMLQPLPKAAAWRGPARQPQQPQSTPMPDTPFMSPEVNGVDLNGPANKREVPQEAKKSIIPGVGEVVFDDDHPMITGKPN